MNKLGILLLFILSSIAQAQVPEDSNINPTIEDLKEIEQVKNKTGTNYRVFVENGEIHVNEICDCYPNGIGLYASEEYKKESVKIKGLALENLIITNKNFKDTNINSYNLNINSVIMNKGLENYFKSRKNLEGMLLVQLILTVSHDKTYQLTELDIKDNNKRKLLQAEIVKNNICQKNQCYSYFFNDYSIVKSNGEVQRNDTVLKEINMKINEKYIPANLEHLDFAQSSKDQLFKIYEIFQINKYTQKENNVQANQIIKKIKEMEN